MPGTCCQIPVKGAGSGRATPPVADALDPQHPHRTIESERDHVADPHRMGGGGHALAVEPHEAGRGERSGIGPCTHHTGVPQPFVNALMVEIFGWNAQDGSLPLCSSCCFSAASLAKGEFGSGCLSREPELPNGLA